MKRLLANLLLFFVVILATTACKKDANPPAPAITRNVQYTLYTAKDFSGVNDTITFELIMKKGSTVIFDSALAPMKVSQIPDKAHAISVLRAVPAGNENADLVVGFLYAIENVGNSWFLDTCKATDHLKTIEYAFQ
jgi:hypothetical protein